MTTTTSPTPEPRPEPTTVPWPLTTTSGHPSVEILCRSSYYTDTGKRQDPGSRIVRCGLPYGHDGDHDEMIDGEPGNSWPQAPAGSTGRPPRASAGASLVSGEYDEAAAHHDALLRQVEQARAENARLRTELAAAREAYQRPAEARQQRDQATEALIQAETERDEAWDRLSNLVDELASALEMSGTPDDHEIIREARAFGQLRVELAALRAEREWLADRARQMGIADAIIATYGPAHAVSAEAGRLRAEVKRLSARVREWEAVHADLAARCDSGDIPTRLGERYSQAVLREIDRLRDLLDEAAREIDERDKLLDIADKTEREAP